jgi:hypothetical protein
MTNQNLSPLVRSFADQPLDQKATQRHNSVSGFMKFAIGILIFFIALGLVGFVFVFIPAKGVYGAVKQLESSGAQVATYIKAQDLAGTQKQFAQIKSDLDNLDVKLKPLAWTQVLPVVGHYYKDAGHAVVAANEILAAGNITIDAIAPYADIIGLKGLATTGDGAKTAEDRINFILNTLDKIKPQLNQIGQRLTNARKEMDQIDPSGYPESVRGVKVREKLTLGISLLDQATSLVTDAKPLLESAPYILGLNSPRKYLMIFQNDAELRPTGGFMTAYALISVNKGKISTLASDDIYALDDKFTKNITAPDAILKYLPKVPYWNLRDMNLSPDFKVSMDTFYPNYKLTGSPDVDGIIAIDTQVLVDLLKITGPIGVSGIGNFSAENDKRCNCPQVFYELELFADVEGPVVWDSVSGQIIVKPKNYGERKSFIGPMMYSVLSNVMAQPKSKMGLLFQSGMELIQRKHIQFYFLDKNTQAAVESFNLAGRVTSADQDYLMVVDTNFAGAKTNAWVTYSSDQKIEIGSDGTVTKTLTLTYKNPQQYFQDAKTQLKLNGIFRDWLRVYVPKGSQLVEATGFETGQTTTEDLGKTVFEGFFTLTPLNVKTISFKYKLPFKAKSPLELVIQKQGGSKDFPYTITVNGKKQPELILNSDKILNLSY